MQRVAIVDIDSILWSLDDPFWEELKKYNSEIPFPGSTGWDFWIGYVTEEEFKKACNKVHYEQYMYKPFEYAKNLLDTLRAAGFHIVIASHRCSGSMGATVRWFSENNLVYNDIRIGSNIEGKFDKASLFDEFDVELIIDDAPSTIKKALARGITVFTIEYFFNKDISNVNFSKDSYELWKAIENYVNKG